MIEIQNQLTANEIVAPQNDGLHEATAADIKKTAIELREVFLGSPITMNNYGANFPSEAILKMVL